MSQQEATRSYPNLIDDMMGWLYVIGAFFWWPVTLGWQIAKRKRPWGEPLLKELCFGWILVAVGVDCYIATYGWFFYYQSWRWIPPIAIGVYIVATFLYALIYFFSEVEEFDDLD